MWKFFQSQGLFAKALKLAVKQLEDKQTAENEKVVLELARSMNLNHVVRYVCMERTYSSFISTVSEFLSWESRPDILQIISLSKENV